jgi:hypothetical protein
LLTKKWLAVAAAVVLAAASLGALPAAAGTAETERALMKAPATDCAVVAEFPGIKNVTTKSYIRKITLNEGLVIRQSRIEDGKIIIPPSGLYYTTRTPKSGVLQGDQVLILGKLYHFVDQATKLDVINDVWVDKGGGAPFGDGTKVLKLARLQMGANGFPAANATFKILKQSGNYYGVAFPVGTSELFTDITSGALNDGTGRKAGSYLPDQKGQDFETEFYASSVAVSGQTYLTAADVGPKGGKVVEFGTGAQRWMLLTEKDPKEALMGAGDTLAGGGFTVKVTEVGSNYAKVELTDKGSGKTWTKKLGPLTAEVLKYMPVDEEERERFVLRDAKDRAQVQMNLYKAGGPFKGGKVEIALYHDLFKLGNPTRWAADERFLFRPDT